MTLDGGVLAGFLVGLFWVVVGLIVWLRLRGRSQASTVGIFLVVAGAMTWFGTLMLAIVPR